MAKKQDTTPSFIAELRLQTSPSDAHKLNTALEAGRALYNACLQESLKRLALMRQSKAYQRARLLPKGKDRTESFKSLREQFAFTKSALQSYGTQTKNACHIGDHLDAHVTQKVAIRAFEATTRYAVGKGGRPRFKRPGWLNSLESKTNASGIRYRDGLVLWRGLEIACIIDPKDEVVAHGLNHPIKYCRLVRRNIKGKYRFYVQLIVEGRPCRKPKHTLGTDLVGLDLGPSTIAYVGNQTAGLEQFCSELQCRQRQIRQIQRKMDRSRRVSNPDNYNPDGTAKKGSRKWVRTERYKALQSEVAELQRAQAEHRKALHGNLCNRILAIGPEINTEKLSYKAWQKMFGKSIKMRAPKTFLSELTRKAVNAGGSVREIPTTCICGRIKKKKLSERWHSCECGVSVRRDLFSAFLARHVDAQDHLDISGANELWQETEPLLRQAVSRIQQTAIGGRALPASFGINSRSQSGSSVKSEPWTETMGRTIVESRDAVAAPSCGDVGESLEKTAVASGRTPCL
ncbi:MAG TPA: transposase [Dissulfurispiraceae bacterium]|nr:transposase [Dissulfurispiraceae bacterium]